MSDTGISNIADITEIARVAANIEDNFNSELGYEESADGKGLGENMNTKDGNSYEIIGEYNFPHPDGSYQKAVVLRKGEEIFFHFNGTGDGNWLYNSVAYGAEPQPSKMQTGCAEWFDQTYESLCKDGKITSNSKIYVTGHSQGGNNAMYVTMRAKNADKIDLCVPLDGPGFSDKFVSDTKEILGEDYYKQTGKIWAFNGEHDFVSILGQNSIVPEGHTKYIKYSKDYVSVMDFHCSGGLIDENGEFLAVLNDDSPIRKRLASAVEKVKDFPPEDQVLAANVIMAIIENVSNESKKSEFRTAELSPEDFERFKPILVPVLAELLAYNPEEIAESLQYLLGVDEETAQSIADLINKFDSYPLETREEILTGLLDLVKYEDGKIDIDTSKIPKLVIEALPVLIETMITNPDDVWMIVQEWGVDKAVGDWISKHPWETAGIIVIAAVTAPIWVPVVTGVIVGGLIIDLSIRIIQGITNIVNGIKDAIVDFFESVKTTINKVKEWFHNKFDKGAKYAKEHPYFKADTDRLYSYATRLQNVNRRLSNLDNGIRSLYWQVGFSDLWDILCADLITCESYSLNKAKSYLTETAERLITADRNVKIYLEG